MAKVKISVVVTVLNEAGSIIRLIHALQEQTLKPYEVIIVDGGSTDDTVQKILRHKEMKLLRETGNRSVGRNHGVANSKGDIIAFTDAGCIPEPNWLEELTRPFSNSSTPGVEVVSGYYEGLAANIFEKCLIPYVLVMPDRAGQTEFFPATRSMALRRKVWGRSGGFSEKLFHNEDYAFAHHLKKLGYSFYFAPKAIVSWLPRKNLKSAAWMFLRFAIGDVQAGIMRPKVRLLILRYYLFFFLVFINRWFSLLLLPYLIWAVAKNYRYVRNWRACFWLPVLQLTADITVLFGTAVGFLSR